jgi:hypothetical protein
VTVRITRVDWHPERAIAAVERARRQGNRRAAERVLDRASGLAPRRTGFLAGSGVIEDDGDDVSVGFGAEYAPVLHAHPEWHYQGGRDARWLETALEQEGSDALGAWAGEIRAEIGL